MATKMGLVMCLKCFANRVIQLKSNSNPPHREIEDGETVQVYQSGGSDKVDLVHYSVLDNYIDIYGQTVMGKLQSGIKYLYLH
jgi:hypothetical protein